MNELKLDQRLDDFWVYPKLTKLYHTRDYYDGFFNFLEKQEINERELNLYIHIPFCDSGCLFCPYYKEHNFTNLDEFITTLIKEIKLYGDSNYFKNKVISSVHIGGGNPLLLEINHYDRLVEAINKNFVVKKGDNWSLEGSVNCLRNVEYIEHLYNLGFTRISLGIQTFDEQIRKSMGIKATIEDIYNSVSILKKFGKMKYCFDMMYNLPNQSDEAFMKDLELVTKLQPYHIDIYNMALFPNTFLDSLVKEKNHFIINPSNERNIHMYQIAINWLNEHNYRQITTNTFSLKQEEIHIGDKQYLANCDVLGIGPSSRGYINGKVYKNVSNYDEWKQILDNNAHPANLSHVVSEEENNDRKMVFFPITLKIRRSQIPNYPIYEDRITQLINQGLLIWEDDTLKLTDKGIIFSGNISSIFMDEKNWNTYMMIFINSLKNHLNPYNEDKMGFVHG